MKTALTLALILFLLWVPAADARRDPVAAAPFAAEADRWIPDALATLEVVPGISVAVVVDDQVVLARAYGIADLNTGAAAEADTQFYIASATKPFTALLAAILDARGTIDLESAFSEHAPGITFAPELHAGEVKLVDLLSHTSGIDCGPIGFRVAYTGQHDPETLWNLLNHCTPSEDAPLGTYKYTNVGYNILTMFLDRELATTWQELLQQEIFGPLGLERTTAYASLGERNGWTVAGPHFGLHPDGVQRLSLVKQDNTMQSAGGMMTTALDAARWLEFQLNLGRVGGTQIVDADVVRRTHEKLTEATGRDPLFEQNGYGYGWSHGTYGGHRVLSHGGGFPGLRSVLSFMPDDGIAVAAMVNEPSVGGELLGAVVGYAYDWWLGSETDPGELVKQIVGMRDAVTPRVAADFEKRAAREWQLARRRVDYAGTYVSDLYGTMEIVEEGGDLRVEFGNLHCTGDPYTKEESMRVELIPGTGEVIVFEPAKGSVTGLHYADEWFERVSAPTSGTD
ncbi:MAG: penicillin-binding protein [Gemmatimonadota bacterium]|nr:MAG: penicillin-binding protein [Gemmatimonadota bacterium]